MKNPLEQRLVIYLPLLLICTLAGAWLGSAAAIWSFAQVVAVIEIIRWLATPALLADKGA